MKMMSEFNRSRLRNILCVLTVVVATAGPALSQSSGNAAKPSSDDGEYSTWDIGDFFGTQWFQLWQGTQNQNHLLEPKVIFGVRATFDPGKYWGIEANYGTAFNRLYLLPYGGTGYASVSESNFQFSVRGLAYLTPRTARYRPFILFGPAGVVYKPGPANSLHQPALGIQAIVPANFSTKTEPGYVYGIGLKINATHQNCRTPRFIGPVYADTGFRVTQLPWCTGLSVPPDQAQHERAAVHHGSLFPRRIPRTSGSGCIGAAASTAASTTTAVSDKCFGDYRWP